MAIFGDQVLNDIVATREFQKHLSSQQSMSRWDVIAVIEEVGFRTRCLGSVLLADGALAGEQLDHQVRNALE